MADAVQVDIPHLSGQTALEAGINTPVSVEAQNQANAARNLSLINIEVAAANDIQLGSKDNFNVATFGVKDISTLKDPVLKPIAEGINQIITMLEANLKVVSGGNAATMDQINQAIETTILSNQGWKKAFESLPGATERQELINTIRETGALSSGRRLYTEKMIIAQESGAYITAKTKYEEIDKQVKARTSERTAVETQINSQPKSKSQIIADKDIATRGVTTLNNKKISLMSRQESLESSIREITNRYLKVDRNGNITNLNQQGLNANPDYQKFTDQLIKVKDEINGTGLFNESIDTKIQNAQDELNDVEKTYQFFQRQDALTVEISTLNEQLATANGDLISARTTLANKVNELLKSLNGVLPEAAKEGMNKYMQAQEQANREKAISDAKKKAEDATKEGDMMTVAEADLTLAVENRYVTQETQKRLLNLFRAKEVNITDVDRLGTEFKGMFGSTNRGSADLIRTILNIGGTPPGLGSGFKQETIDYLVANPKAAEKLIDKMRIPIFKSVSRQAVRHLNLTRTDIMALGNSPAFIEAAKVAITENAELLKIAESLTGAKLAGGRNFKEAVKSMPVGGLLGLIMAIFGMFGTSLFTKRN